MSDRQAPEGQNDQPAMQSSGGTADSLILPTTEIWRSDIESTQGTKEAEDILRKGLQKNAEHRFFSLNDNLFVIRYYINRSTNKISAPSNHITVKSLNTRLKLIHGWHATLKAAGLVWYQRADVGDTPPQLPPREMVIAARMIYKYKFDMNFPTTLIKQMELDWFYLTSDPTDEDVPHFWRTFKNTIHQTRAYLTKADAPRQILGPAEYLSNAKQSSAHDNVHASTSAASPPTPSEQIVQAIPPNELSDDEDDIENMGNTARRSKLSRGNRLLPISDLPNDFPSSNLTVR